MSVETVSIATSFMYLDFEHLFCLANSLIMGLDLDLYLVFYVEETCAFLNYILIH
jgi:hypothetical protein